MSALLLLLLTAFTSCATETSSPEEPPSPAVEAPAPTSSVDCQLIARDLATTLTNDRAAVVDPRERGARECRTQIEAAAYPHFLQTCEAQAASVSSTSSLEAYYRQQLATYEALQSERYPGEKAQWITFYRDALSSLKDSNASLQASASRQCEASARSQASLFAAGIPTTVTGDHRSGARSATTTPPATSPAGPSGGYNEQGCPKNQYVSGYTRKDGTRVEGYYRNSPSDGCGGG